MNLLFTCRKCGVQSADLSEHRCARVDEARAVLKAVEARVGATGALDLLGPPRRTVELDIPATAAERYPAPALPKKVAAPAKGFDRNAYQRAYMKAWRARKRPVDKPEGA